MSKRKPLSLRFPKFLNPFTCPPKPQPRKIVIDMADFTALSAAVQALSDKVDALVAKASAPAPDEQPQVDAVKAAVDAVAAKIQ